ncbi:MAG: hypothetical protein RL095_114 [Verrucomicrobiota bacterium]|jgi:putative membrane protein insertion efficiency factor
MKAGLLAWLGERAIRGYQLFIGPLLPKVCRFHPSCSEYGRLCFLEHGFLRGFFYTAGRLLRCHPWYRGSSYDPVPPPTSDRNQSRNG